MSASTTSKVFIGSIPHTVSEEQLRSEVSQYGSVTQLFYMQDQVQQNRGWAFVTYSGREEAIRCINAVDSKLQFPGSTRPVEARFANQKPTTLSSPTFPTPTPNNSLPMKQPSPWQQYFTAEGHPYYYNAITAQTQWERPAEMDSSAVQAIGVPPYNRMAIAASMGGGGGGSTSFGPPGSNLFVFHLPSDWNDIDLVQHFQHFGNILSARIQRDTNGRNRGFGFVSFDNTQSSINAIRGMNGFSVGGKYLKVQLKKGEEHFLPPDALMPVAGGPQGPPFAMSAAGGGGMPQAPLRYAPY
eukprot:GHVS01015634.1.p1 GENE.GHVS01015634.1~~GHVS01015634.1.p1  ORF type:complete len:299 (+),score=47.75 GHVS01015634.1:109-1005(+)